MFVSLTGTDVIVDSEYLWLASVQLSIRLPVTKHGLGLCGMPLQPAEAGVASVQGQPAARRPAAGAAEEAA